MKTTTKASARTTSGGTRPAAKAGHWFFRWFGPLIISDLCIGLTLTDRKVLDALVRFVRRDGRSWASHRTLARYIGPGASPSRARASIKKFVERGIITHVERGDLQHTNVYHLWCGVGVGATGAPTLGATGAPTIPPSEECIPPDGKQNDVARGARRSSSSQVDSASQVEMEAIEAVRAVCPDFDDTNLILAVVRRIGLPDLLDIVKDVQRRKPLRMKNRAGYLATCLRERLTWPVEPDDENTAADDENLTVRPVRSRTQPSRRDEAEDDREQVVRTECPSCGKQTVEQHAGEDGYVYVCVACNEHFDHDPTFSNPN